MNKKPLNKKSFMIVIACVATFLSSMNAKSLIILDPQDPSNLKLPRGRLEDLVSNPVVGHPTRFDVFYLWNTPMQCDPGSYFDNELKTCVGK